MMKGRKKIMQTIREVLRLNFEYVLGQRAIFRACTASPSTVGENIATGLQASIYFAHPITLGSEA